MSLKVGNELFKKGDKINIFGNDSITNQNCFHRLINFICFVCVGETWSATMREARTGC